ncbi:jg24419 [Pararge aegeria aegeria]|uniref:Jg24419 protein n=1 Tax=Pararge aegeria aegeria TaxID=348720 RepID=A0A8S4RK93_9NEOP|nr:jg24419 [Pararge aegeria aegeria]
MFTLPAKIAPISLQFMLTIKDNNKCKLLAVDSIAIHRQAASQYISDARWRCVAGAWLRELGFVACYGSVVLRLWVLLAEFRTRKAHRWTPRDSEVLRIVAAMVLGAACYLAAFTATAACDEDASAGCARAAWHHVTAAAELLLLAAGLRIAHAARNANVPFQVSRRGPAEGFGAEGEEEPTSEEVRAELKRLYVQLEIMRNQTLRRDNPHISKRRGGRKPPHRRFSLQALQARRGGKNKASSQSVVEASEAGDASRTPEDSVCSIEGPSHYTDGDTLA